jgi:tetrahydromethanopterin S-methyltransferase subunit B
MSTHRTHRPTIGRTHHGHISTARFTLAIGLVIVVLLALILVVTLFAPPVG